MPNITVLMPVYNAGKYLEESVHSIVEQTCQDFELLIIDDGSDDGATQAIDELKDSRIKIVYRPRSGLGAALQFGVERCRTPFLARMDADDICDPSRLSLQLRFLESHPEIGAVGTQFTYFVAERLPAPSQRLPLTHEEIRALLLTGSSGLVHASMMFRTDDLRRCGGYRVQGRGEDWDMFLRLCEVAAVANLPDKLYWWRLHRGNQDWRKMTTELFAVKHAIACATARDSHRPEVSFESFLFAQSLGKRWGNAIEARGAVHYRKSLCAFALHRRFAGCWHLLIAGVMCPRRAARRIARIGNQYLITPSPNSHDLVDLSKKL
jgi:glycosyltransferase involved in cell wall biosynthesis